MNTDFLIFTLLITIAGLLGLMLGSSLESNRLYNKCLNENSTLQYDAAIKLCKERVK